MPLIESMLMLIDTQGGSGPQIYLNNLLRLINSTIQELLEYWMKLYQNNKSLSRTDGVDGIE